MALRFVTGGLTGCSEPFRPDPDDLRRLTVAFYRISGEALSREATRAQLKEMIEGLV